MPPTPERYVFQCECGGTLTIRRGETITCPSCGCVHKWANLYQRLDYPTPSERKGAPGE